jgi:hypothetical protein
MNRLDTSQLEMRPVDTRTAERLVWCTMLVTTVAVVAAAAWGASTVYNPTDQAFAALAWLPLGLLVPDLWSFMVAFLRRGAPTPLRIPYKTPTILTILHLAAALAASHLVRFESLYELVWVDDRLAHYEVQWLPATGLVLLAIVSLVLSVFEIRLVRWVLISEVTSRTSASISTPGEPVVEDIELGTEHIYEAQVLLNNLGYEVASISGELNDATSESIKHFQEASGLDVTGSLTARTMIDLRNLWREKENESSPALAVSEHAVKRTGTRIAGFFKRS